MSFRISDIDGHYIYLTIDDTEYRIFYEEAGHGTPILCQHTAGSHAAQWRHLLEDRDYTSRYRLIAYDLPYHGKSVPPVQREWWKENYALHQDFLMKLVVSLADALDLEAPIFMGCSMGGHLAPDLALHYPGRFKAVIAIEGGLATHDDEPFQKFLYHPRVSNDVKAALMITQTSPRSPEALRRETGWVYSQGAPSVFKGDCNYYLWEHDLTATAGQIDTARTQVHVLSGDYDWSATPERCRALADAIPGATFTQMAGMGHFPMSENPVGFKPYLQRVLDLIEAS